MTVTVCPFCGVVTDVTHEAQQACIYALQMEIACVRQALDLVTPLPFPDDPREPADHPPQRPNR